MSPFRMFAVLFVVAISAPHAHAVEQCRWKLSFDGIGPLKVGMTKQQAERALGTKLGLVREENGEYLYRPNICPRAFSFNITDSVDGPNRITVIYAGTVKTVDDIGLGETEGTLKNLMHNYPRRSRFEQKDHYDKIINAYALYSDSIASSNNAIVYFAPNGKVTQIRAGRVHSVFGAIVKSGVCRVNQAAACWG